MNKSVILLFPLFAGVILAQGKSSGLANLKLPTHAREASLAEATVADPSTPSSFVLNPSLLEFSRRPEIAVSHQRWMEDVQSNSLLTILPISIGVFGIVVSSTSISGIQLRNQPGPALGSFTSRYATVGISSATAISQRIRAGISLKYLYEKIFVDEADGWGLDLGLAYQPKIEGLTIGASVLNVGSMGNLRSSSTELPTCVLLGAAYESPLEERATLRGLASIQRYLEGEAIHASVGFEIDYGHFFMLRGGYVSGYSSRGISVGLGFVSLPFLFDYSFAPFSFSLGNTHIVSLGLRL